MKIEACIIADDFTGAGDSSIYFCHAGYSVLLPLSLNKEDIPLPPDVLAINSESRLIGEDEAFAKVSRTLQKCIDLGAGSFYKKIDSTLRGNIDAEVKAFFAKAGYRAVVICPASPDVGRTVVSGQCLIHSKPINMTESGKDHLNPVGSADIRDLFHSVSDSRIHHVSIGELESCEDFRAEVEELTGRGFTHIICDAVTHTHLRKIASLFSNREILLAGSAGLAKAIASTMQGKKLPPETELFSRGEIMVLSGSRMEVSRKQIRKLSEAGRFKILEIPVAALLNKDESALKDFNKSLALLDPSYMPILIPGDPGRDENQSEIKGNSEAIADFMAETASELCHLRNISVLVIVGGHTTYKTMKKMSALGVLYEGEVIPGSPFGRLITADRREDYSLVTKSGSFGDENALVDITDFIEKRMGKKI